MDASRLLAVVDDIETEFNNGFLEALTALIQEYTAARDTPAQDNTPAIKVAFDALTSSVKSSVFADYPPSKVAILDAIKALHRVGPGFEGRLNEILSVSGQTTAGIVTGLTELQADLRRFQKACSQTKTGLQSLGVIPYTLEVGAFEAGILIPEELVDSQLGNLVKELEAWNRIVRGFQEIAGEEEREVVVTGLASGSYEVYIPLGIVAASILARTIGKVLEWYRQILELRKLRLEIQKLGAPASEPEVYKKHERDTLEKNILEFAKEIIQESNSKLDPTRKNELETQIKLSITQIARFVDKGGIVEVYTEPADEPKEPPAHADGETATPEATKEHERLMTEYKHLKLQFESTSYIRETGSLLRLLPERSEPILQLPDDSGDESPQSEKSSKKKS